MTANNNPLNARVSRRTVLALILVVLAGVTVADRFGWLNLRDPTHATESAAASAGSPDAVAVAIAQETAKIVVKPRPVVPSADNAAAVRRAVQRGEYDAADKIIDEVYTHSKLENWHFSPFNDLMAYVTFPKDDAFLESLNKWLQQNPQSAFAHLIRANYYYRVGVNRRGSRFVSETPESDLNAFREYMKLATADALDSTRLDARNPYAYFTLLRIYSMSGNTPIMENAFQDAISRFPNYYPLYTERLETLAPKWGGSPQAMVAFVERYAGHAPENSPLRLLHVELYASLLNTAALACDAYRAEQLEQCVGVAMESMAGGDVMRQVDTALELYNKTDRYQFTVALQPLLSEIVRMSGAGHFAGSMLEAAASHMGTQLQLSESNAGHNNYMLDVTVANVWQNKRHYDNAEKKYREALVDVAAFPFPGEAERTWAMVDIYQRMSGLYNDMAQYENVIAYQDAAEAMGASGGGYKHLKCFAYYKLKHFEEAVRDCTKQLESGDDMQTRYWRAKSNLATGRSSAALEDFNVVADSQDHHFRTSAAIDISVIYGNRKDMPSMLESLNRHAYLFDEKGQSEEDLAISYNNRCYAYMQLGRLQEALADCEVSLKHGNLPDAYQKYQELLKKVRPEPNKPGTQDGPAI